VRLYRLASFRVSGQRRVIRAFSPSDVGARLSRLRWQNDYCKLELERPLRRHLNPKTESWRVEEARSHMKDQA
jgi:hypothetical protein